MTSYYIAYEITDDGVVLSGMTEITVVATVGKYGYTTLQDAINAAANGQTVILVSDVELSDTLIIANGATVILDLNGKTINAALVSGSTTNHIYAIENNGNLTITGNGVINSRGNQNYGTLILESGTINAIDCNGGYAIKNLAGTFVMNGGTVATTYEDDHLVDKGGYDATTIRVESGSEFIMTERQSVLIIL